MQTLVVPQGQFHLARYPHRAKDPLRAWDAGDEYLLYYLHDEHLPNQDAAILILNDTCGALATTLAPNRPQSLSDSHLAHQATLANLQHNDCTTNDVRLLSSLTAPKGPLDLVLCKIPKSLALLEDQLHRIRPYLHPQTRFIGAGMTRDIHTSTLDLLTRIIGPTHTSLAKKKARLICSEFDVALDPGPTLYPTYYSLEGTDHTLINHANVFSRNSLDIGTRLFLEHVPTSDEKRTIVDLGCGNGVIGLIAAARNPQAELIFIDESFMAVASARENFQAAMPARKVSFAVADGLENADENSSDLILCNPPFHQQRAVDDATARRMFHQARAALKKGGELWIVGNRHLGYHARLKRLFNSCETIASNRKFVVLRSVKR